MHIWIQPDLSCVCLLFFLCSCLLPWFWCYPFFEEDYHMFPYKLCFLTFSCNKEIVNICLQTEMNQAKEVNLRGGGGGRERGGGRCWYHSNIFILIGNFRVIGECKTRCISLFIGPISVHWEEPKRTCTYLFLSNGTDCLPAPWLIWGLYIMITKLQWQWWAVVLMNSQW